MRYRNPSIQSCMSLSCTTGVRSDVADFSTIIHELSFLFEQKRTPIQTKVAFFYQTLNALFIMRQLKIRKQTSFSYIWTVHSPRF